MLETQGLGIEGQLEVKKIHKGKVIGIAGTAVAALAVAAGLQFFVNNPQVEELDMSLVNPDFQIEQPFTSFVVQPSLIVGGTDLLPLTREERAAFISDSLAAQRETRFTAVYGAHTIETTLGELGLGLNEDMDAILDRLDEAELRLVGLSESQRRVPAVFDLNYAASAEGIANWASSLGFQFNTPVVEPSLRMHGRGNFQVTSGQQGTIVDTEQFVQDALVAINQGETENPVELVSQTINPRFDESLLASVNTVVAGFSSQFDTSIPRAQNVRRGAEIINGHVIMPGETFNYNNLFPSISTYNGFVYGTIFVNGEQRQGLGGGLCQVSSTLYGAILRLGIVPTLATPHSNRVHYVPGGLDACMWTEAGSPCNVIFTNPYDFPLYLTASADGGTLNVEFWSRENALGEFSFVPRSEMASSSATHEAWNSWLRTYRNGSFVSEQFLRHDIYRP